MSNSDKMMSSVPSEFIFRFNQLTDFLSAYHLERKHHDPTWSYEKWARLLKKNKSWLVRVVRGSRPILEKEAAFLCVFFKFDEEAARYFHLLIAYQRIYRLYPGLTFNLAELEEVRSARLRILKISSNSPDLALLAMPETSWLSALSSNADLSAALKPARFHQGLKPFQLEQSFQEASRLFVAHPMTSGEIYLDSEITGRDLALARYRRTLDFIRSMMEFDYKAGVKPQVNNQSCAIKIRHADLLKLSRKASAFITEAVAEYSTANGDTIVDLQVFISIVAKLANWSWD